MTFINKKCPSKKKMYMQIYVYYIILLAYNEHKNQSVLNFFWYKSDFNFFS